MRFPECLSGLESVLRSRGVVDVSQWDKLHVLVKHLGDVSTKSLSYTCMHPACAGCSHTLGTVEGNLHFLLGYVNPRFHVAPYHWFFVDPFLTSDHTEELEHPSNASCCASFGELSDEGDIEKDKRHGQGTKYIKKGKIEFGGEFKEEVLWRWTLVALMSLNLWSRMILFRTLMLTSQK